MKNRLLAILSAFGLLAASAAALAQSAPQGSGNFVGRDRLRVPRCGHVAHPLNVDVTVAANGNWTIDAGAAEYSGTSTQLRPRLLQLTLDGGSATALQSKLQTDASALCSQAVTVTSVTRRAVIKVNKKETRGAVLLRARATGTGTNHEGTGVYELAGRGPWVVPVP